MEEHQRFFPKCAFVLGEYCGNMPVEIDPDVNCEKSNFKSAVEQAPTNNSGPGMNNYSKSDIPCYPIFSEPSNRSKTYSHANWRSPLGRQQLIDSGFFYTGTYTGSLLHRKAKHQYVMSSIFCRPRRLCAMFPLWWEALQLGAK